MAYGWDESNIFFNNNDDDDGVMVMVWMGPVAPTPTNLSIHQFTTLANRQFLKPSPSLKIHDFK